MLKFPFGHEIIVMRIGYYSAADESFGSVYQSCAAATFLWSAELFLGRPLADCRSRTALLFVKLCIKAEAYSLCAILAITIIGTFHSFRTLDPP